MNPIKPMMVALSTFFFISLEYYLDLQCITISYQCYNLLATSMFIKRKKKKVLYNSICSYGVGVGEDYA